MAVINLKAHLKGKIDDKVKLALEKLQAMPKKMEPYLEAFWLIIVADLVKSVAGEVEPGEFSQEIFDILSEGHKDCYFNDRIDGNAVPFSDGTTVCLLCAVKVRNILEYKEVRQKEGAHGTPRNLGSKFH